MTRSRASAKKAGSSFERLIADYLAESLHDDRIDRKVKTGSLDKGDVGGVRVHDQRATIECKDSGGQFKVGTWLGEAEVERVNDGALVTLVAAKRRGTRDPGDQVIFMTARDLVALITGKRPD